MVVIRIYTDMGSIWYSNGTNVFPYMDTHLSNIAWPYLSKLIRQGGEHCLSQISVFIEGHVYMGNVIQLRSLNKINCMCLSRSSFTRDVRVVPTTIDEHWTYLWGIIYYII